VNGEMTAIPGVTGAKQCETGGFAANSGFDWSFGEFLAENHKVRWNIVLIRPTLTASRQMKMREV
jgi:hypothetical protein